MTAETPFLNAIAARPHDIAVPLIYADWLDEQDTPDTRRRAEWLRLTVELTTAAGPVAVTALAARIHTLASQIDATWRGAIAGASVLVLEPNDNDRLNLRQWPTDGVPGPGELLHSPPTAFYRRVNRRIVRSHLGEVLPGAEPYSHLGCSLFADRYVLTPAGGIVDVRTWDVLREPDDAVRLSATASEVIFQFGHAPSEYRYVAFEFASRAERELAQPNLWELPGVRSPDGQRTLQGVNDTVYLYEVGAAPRAIARGYQVPIDWHTGSTMSRNFVLAWLDDANFVMSAGNGVLVQADLSGQVRPLVTLPVEHLPMSPPELYWNESGQLCYHHLGKQNFVIDCQTRTFDVLHWEPLGHGFEWELSHPEHENRVRYRGEEIGRVPGRGSYATACGRLAVGFRQGRVGERGGCVMVWTAWTGAWETRVWTGVEYRQGPEVLGWLVPG